MRFEWIFWRKGANFTENPSKIAIFNQILLTILPPSTQLLTRMNHIILIIWRPPAAVICSQKRETGHLFDNSGLNKVHQNSP